MPVSQVETFGLSPVNFLFSLFPNKRTNRREEKGMMEFGAYGPFRINKGALGSVILPHGEDGVFRVWTSHLFV